MAKSIALLCLQSTDEGRVIAEAIKKDNEGITENHYSYFFDENELCFTLKHEF